MSSLFNSRDENTPTRSGGKILRQRSRTTPSPSPSPYARPREISPEAAQLRSPRWLSGFFSGAGKIISSVLPTRASSPDEYSSSEEEGGEGSGFDDDKEEYFGFDKAGMETENKCMNESLATIPKTDTKRVIEQMVKKETFSRAECDRLIKLIQSRVIDSSSRDICRDGAGDLRRTAIQQESSLPFGLKQSFTESVPHLSEPFVLEACTPDRHGKAMLEAKMWLDEKKSASKTNNDSKTCTSNNEYGFNNIEISPVDIAKSYMKSLPPWRSPSYSGFKAPPSRLNHYRDDNNEIYDATTDIALPSSEGRTRDYLDFATLDTSNVIRRVRSRRIYDQLDLSKSKNSEKSTGTSEHVNNKSVNTDNEALQIKISSSDCNGNANLAIETTNLNSSSNLSEPELITSIVHETVEISLSDSHPLEPTQHSEELPCKEGGGKISVSHGTVTSASRLVEHDRNTSSEREVPVAENKESAMLSKSLDAEDLNDVENSSQQTSTGVHHLHDVENSSQQTSTGVKDQRPQDKTCYTSNETNGSIVPMDSLLTEAQADVVHEPQSEATDKLTSQNVTKMDSIETLPTEPKTKAIRRGRRTVAQTRRGRKS